MKPHRVAVWLWVPLLAASFAVVVPVSIEFWHHVHLFYPTPETESSFLKSYTPERIIAAFSESDQGSSHARNMSGGAGRDYVSHQGGFEFNVVLRREEWVPLLNALRGDALQQLCTYQAEVLSQSGDPYHGFHVEYKISRSFGSLTILPIATTPPTLIRRNVPLPRGSEGATVRLEQTEKWFPHGFDTTRAGVMSPVH